MLIFSCINRQVYDIPYFCRYIAITYMKFVPPTSY